MSNRTDFTLNDVRDYLIDTGAIREAEALLLGDDDKEKPTNKRTSTVINAIDKTADKRIEQLRGRQGKEDLLIRRETLMSTLLSQKHAGAIGLIREEEEIRNLKAVESKLREDNLKLAQERQAIAAQLREQKRDQLVRLEKQSEMDLLQLEMQRQDMEKNLNKKKMHIEKLQQELRVTETNIDNFGKKGSSNNNDDSAEAKAAQSSEERHKEMQKLATEHAIKLAETRANTLQAKKELENLNNGNWNLNSQSISNQNSSDGEDKGSYELTENAKELIESLQQKSGDKIVFSDDGLNRHQRRVDDLKRQMNNQEDQFTKSVKLRPLQVKGLNTDSKDDEGIIPGMSNDGTLTSTAYLEKWLEAPGDYKSNVELMRKIENDNEELSRKQNNIKKVEATNDNDENPVIRQLQEEIKRMKESQASGAGSQNPNANANPNPHANPYANNTNPYMNPNANPYTNPYNPYGPPNPYGSPNPFMNPYMAPPHMNPFMAPPHMNPYMAPPHMNPMPQADPHQQMMLQQIQKMAEQIEKENSKLMGHLSGEEIPISNNKNGSRSMGPNTSPIKKTAKLTRLEMQHEEEIRLMELEMEKIKKKQELEEVKAAVAAERAERLANEEHSRLVNEQKQQLQQIKLKQALLKEERILQNQTEKSGMSSKGTASTKTPSTSSNAGIREESQVGLKTPVDINLIKGVAILSDGILLAKEKVEGDVFRLAVGFYDAKGSSLGKVLACPWTNWKSTDDARLLPTDLVTHGPEIPYKRTMKQTDRGLVSGVKFMVEVQTKADNGSPRSLGWGHLSFVSEDNGNLALMNGLWRVPIRIGIPDVKMDPTTPLSPSNPIFGWILLRILDDNDSSLAVSWTIDNSSLKSSKDILDNYSSIIQDISESSPIKSSRASVPSLVDIASIKNLVDHKLSGKKEEPMSAKQPASARPASGGGVSARPSESARPQSASRGGAQAPMLSPIPDDYDGQDLEDEGDDEVVNDRKVSSDVPWKLGTPTQVTDQKYQRGDGVDLYIDGAMFLPDNVSVSRVVLKIVTAEKENVGNVFEGYSKVSGSAISPSYNLKAEIRVPVLNTTAICLMRIDTLDSNSMQPCSVGYAVLKLFTTKEKKQPTASNDSNALLNVGLFQLPIYGGRVPNLPVFDENMLNSLPKIPCATLLVRIYDAPKSADGMSTLNKEDFSPEESIRLGLDKPAPIYSTGAYDGSLCEPTALEKFAYKAKEYTNNDTVEAILRQGMSASNRTDFPVKPDSSNDAEMKDWCKKLLPTQDQMRKTINFVYTAPYSEDAGLKASVEFLFNMPDTTGLFSSETRIYKCIYSIVPPGLYYKDPPLTEGVSYTKNNEFDKSSFRCPAFTDGYAEFFPTLMQQNLYLLVDVRIIKVEPAKGPDPMLVIEPASTRKSFWSLFPLSRERIKGQGYKYTVGGIFQLPLIEGAVPKDIFSCENPMQEFLDKLESRDKAPGATLKVSEGCSVVVKVVNPLLEELQKKDLFAINSDTLQTSFMTGIINASLKGTSTNKADKFTYEPAKFTATKKVKETLPSTVTDVKKFLRNVNRQFAAQCKLPSEP